MSESNACSSGQCLLQIKFKLCKCHLANVCRVCWGGSKVIFLSTHLPQVDRYVDTGRLAKPDMIDT